VYHRGIGQPALALHDSREWALWAVRRAQAAGLDVPGVAEALVLADQVVVHAQTTPHTWTPIGGPP